MAAKNLLRSVLLIGPGPKDSGAEDTAGLDVSSPPTDAPPGMRGMRRGVRRPSSSSGWRFLVTHRQLMVSGGLLVLIILAALILPLWLPNPNAEDLFHVLRPPAWLPGGSSAHLLGTDELGRDELARLASATRVTLIVCSIATVLSAVIGTILGMIAGYSGGIVDELIMRLVDLQMSVPGILLVLVALAIVAPSDFSTVVILAISAWMLFARIARAEAASLRSQGLVIALRSIGVPAHRILLTHVFRNIVGSILVVATVTLGSLITALAALSYLGFGIPPPTPTLGGMIADGQQDLTAGIWWPVVWPCIVIVLIVLCVNSLGDGLSAFFNYDNQDGIPGSRIAPLELAAQRDARSDEWRD